MGKTRPKAVGSAKAEIDKGYSENFAREVQKHLALLEVTQSEFSEKAKLSPADLHRWLDDTRGVSRAAVNRIAVALCQLYDEKGRSKGENVAWQDFTRGQDYLDRMLGALMKAAGFGGQRIDDLEDRDNFVWEQITRVNSGSERVIKMGWVQCEPWSRGPKGAPTGVAIEIAKRVAELLGMRPLWTEEPLKWGELAIALSQRRIDLIPPFMMLAPWRLADFHFSHPISEEEEDKKEIAALANPSNKTHGKEGPKFVDDLLPSLRVGYVADEIGGLARFVLTTNHDPKEHTTFAEALAWLREKPTESDSVLRCVTSERSACEASTGSDLTVLKIKKLDMKFGLAFAARPREFSLISAV